MTGQDIRRWRLDNDLTQRELADIVGVTKKTIYCWESERTKPPPTALLLLDIITRAHTLRTGLPIAPQWDTR